MPLFKRKTGPRRQVDDNNWDEWKQVPPDRAEESPHSSPAQQKVLSGRPPRGILRNSSYGQDGALNDPRRHSVPNATASPRTVPQGRERFKSLPASNSLSAIPSERKDAQFGDVATSNSLSKLNARNNLPYNYDPESDRLDRACGQGAWASSRLASLTLESRDSRLSCLSGRSRSLSRSRSRESHYQRSRQDGSAPRFPMPPIQQAIRDLSRILRDRTKRFRLKDYLEPEELASGRIWEEEEETLVDCVRDRLDDEDGEDGIWRLERKKRKMKRQAERERCKNEGIIFGAHLQDLPTIAMARVVIGGYTHVVPMIVDACVEELYRTGAYQPHLFRSLPNRKRLLELVTHFDQAQARARANTIGVQGDMKVYAKTQSLRVEHTPDICALLVTYLSALPDALIHRSLSDALWAWCVSPSIIRQEQRLRRRGDDDASESEYETSEDEDENAPSYNARLRQMELERMDLPPLKVQILISRHVLLLLPARYFALLSHLMTFFATLLICSENGLSAEDIGAIFGPALVAGKTRRRKQEAAQKHEEDEKEDVQEGQEQGPRRDDKEKKIMAWLVSHWERISTAYEARPKDERGRASRRARSSSFGLQDEPTPQNRRGSRVAQSCGPDSRRSSAQIRASKDDNAPRHDRTPHVEAAESTPRRQKRDSRGDVADYLIPCPSVQCSSLTSASTASSSPADPPEIPETFRPYPKPGLTETQGKGKGKDRPRGGDRAVQVRDAEEMEDLPDRFSQLSMSHPELGDDVSVYSDGDDVLCGILGRYLGGDEVQQPQGVKPMTPPGVKDVSLESVECNLDRRRTIYGKPSNTCSGDSAVGRENADLRRQLELVLRERDEARGMVAAMRHIIQSPTVPYRS